MPESGRSPKATAAGACLAAAALLATPVSGEDWRLGPGIGFSSKKNHFEVKLGGYVQGDLRSYPNWEVGDSETGPLRNDSFDLRRARIGFGGKWKQLEFELDVDLTQPGRRLTRDGVPDPYLGWGSAELKDAAVSYEFTKALNLRAGHFKPPVSLEFLTSASKIDFVERSLIGQNLAPFDRDWGAMLFGELKKRVNYQVGVFAGDGRVSESRSETMLAARVLFEAIKDVNVGASFSHADVKAPPEPPAELLVVPRELIPQPNGFGTRGPSGFRFSERRFVEGTRLRLGLEATLARGPFGAKGEYLHGREERKGQSAIFTDLPEEVGNGWTVSATWLATGEKKARTIKPKKPLPRGIGAVEIGARYEQIRYDDIENVGFEAAGNRARNMRPAGLNVLTGGFSWWPTEWVRLMGNVVLDHYTDPLLAPVTNRRGEYVTLLARLQLHFP